MELKIINGRLRYKTSGQNRKIVFVVGEGDKRSNSHLELFSEIRSVEEGRRLALTITPLSSKEKSAGSIEIKELVLVVTAEASRNTRVFLNGYQSWTESREYALEEKPRPLLCPARPLLKQYGDYGFYRGSNLHSWTYSYLTGRDGRVDFVGSLDERTGFTIFEYKKGHNGVRLVIRKDCAGLLINRSYKAFDLFFAQGEENEVFDRYFAAMGIPKPQAIQGVGWTSWYNYYTRVSEGDILQNLEAFQEKNIPLDFFQIDDGYQNAVGDWLEINHKFPRGMGFLAERIKDSGYQAGLWLAPFVCERRSKLFAEHPDWVARDHRGRLARAGYNTSWTGFFYALDFYNSGFRDYLRKVFDVVLWEWGYDLVKLDFLYAAALAPRKDQTRGEVMREAMEFLRELAGEKLILGCGVPLGAAFGLVDFCRIGGDIALQWEDRGLKALRYRERVSTINSLTNTIGRRHLQGRAFLNDPDVFILRNQNQRLSQEQKNTLFLINLIFGGLLFTSDYIANYSPEEWRLFQRVFQPTPDKLNHDDRERPIASVERVLFDRVYMIYFTIKHRRYLALCNLTKRSQRVILPKRSTGKGYYYKSHGIQPGGSEFMLKSYATRCLLLLEGGEAPQDEWIFDLNPS